MSKLIPQQIKFLLENPKKSLKMIESQIEDMGIMEKELAETREELLQANRAAMRISQAVSSCPPASAVDSQLASMYMNFLSGIYAEIKEEQGDGTLPDVVRRDCMNIAHTEAMQLTKQFRKEILDGRIQDHNGTTHGNVE